MTPKEANEILEMFLHKQCDLKRTEFAYNQNEVWQAVDMANSALEKQIPKKPPKDQYGFYVCPSCGADDYALMHDNNIADRYNHCHNCGQALDWGDCE